MYNSIAMKKLFTLLFAAFAVVCNCFAQEEIDETFQFVNSAGDVVKDGSEITLTELTKRPMYGDIMKPDLFVKNTSKDNAICSIAYNVTDLSNGGVQLCFPENCIIIEEVGNGETGQGTLLPDEAKSLESEWIPLEYGTAKVKYQIKVYTSGLTPGSYIPAENDGPSITVNFVYSENSGINDAVSGVAADEVARYSLDGRVLSQPAKGLNIVKTADGKVRKVLVK